MSKTYRAYDPNQQFPLPAAMQEWLPPDHLSYFISDIVDHLDLSAITSVYERESRGGPPYHPRMMVKVLLYGYCIGVASSRRIAQRLYEDIAFRVLSANNTPDFRTISDFHKDHLSELSELFLQVLVLCQRAGLVKLGHVSLDGTKVKANASKHKAMSYGRMKEKSAQLESEVDELLRRAEEMDEGRCLSRTPSDIPHRLWDGYEEVGSGRFRTAGEIPDWIESEYGVRFKGNSIYSLLQRLGCSPKVPRPRREKADVEAQDSWKKGGLVVHSGERELGRER